MEIGKIHCSCNSDEIDESEAYPSVDCITPGDPYVLHCFLPHKIELTHEHRIHLKIISNKIQESLFSTRPITKVKIVGHSSKWHKTPSSTLEQRALQRANSVRKYLRQLGIPKQIDIVTRGDSDTKRWLDKPYSSTSSGKKAQNDRAMNRRVEIRLISIQPPKKKKPVKPKKPRGTIHIRRLGCKISDKKEIDFHIKQAVRKIKSAKKRFRVLELMTDDAREKSWNLGQEKLWFGSYKRGKIQTPFKFVKQTIDQIFRIIRKPPRLIIRCNYELGKNDCTFGAVNRDIPDRDYTNPMQNPLLKPDYEIFLASCWFNQPNSLSQTKWELIRSTTIIHEAAHLAGARRLFNAKLFRTEEIVDIKSAKRLARRNAWGARVNAQNYAYYVMGTK